MNSTCYSPSDLSSALNLISDCLTGSIGSDGFFRELASLLDSDLAGMMHLHQRMADSNMAIFSAPEMKPAVAELRSHLVLGRPSMNGALKADFVTSGDTLASILPKATEEAFVLVAYRQRGGFTDKERHLLHSIHAAVQSRLTALPVLQLQKDKSLSPRLLQVREGLLDGLSDKQIAARIRISPHTVHTYVKALFKLDRVNSRSELLSVYLKANHYSVRESMPPVGRHSNQFPSGQFELGLQNIAAADPVSTVLGSKNN